MDIITKLKENFAPHDWIAIIVILGGFVLLATGKTDPSIGAIITAITAFYFGTKAK